jgi:hypothetical protein
MLNSHQKYAQVLAKNPETTTYCVDAPCSNDAKWTCKACPLSSGDVKGFIDKYTQRPLSELLLKIEILLMEAKRMADEIE